MLHFLNRAMHAAPAHLSIRSRGVGDIGATFPWPQDSLSLSARASKPRLIGWAAIGNLNDLTAARFASVRVTGKFQFFIDAVVCGWLPNTAGGV